MNKIQYKASLNIISFILITTFGFVTASAQSIKYDDLYEELPKLKPTQALFKLNKFQKQDPFFVNTYLQIGQVCEKQIKSIDPFRELDQAHFWADNANLYYGIYPNFTKKGEVKRNKEFYTNLSIPSLGGKLTDEETLNYVNTRMNHFKEYKEKTTQTFNALEKSKEQYNNAITMYTEINHAYENMNELYLHTDDEVLHFIDSLHKTYYDFRLSFERYKQLLEDYPIAGYNQKYKLKRIETFRLDGLTSSDFLENEFIVWDYDYWVNTYNNTYKNEILPLREEISEIQEGFDKNKIMLDQLDTISTDTKLATYDNLFFYKLGRYDNYSVVKDLFKYLDFRQQFFKYGNAPISSPSDSNLVMKNTKLRYYSKLTIKHEETLVELDKFKKSITKEKVARFKQFFIEYYDGSEGLMDFAESEKEIIYENMKTDFKKLKSYYINQEGWKQSVNYAAHIKDSIATFKNNNALDSNEVALPYTTTHINYDQGKPNYIAGSYASKKDTTEFIAKINRNDSVMWYFNDFKNKQADHHTVNTTFGYSGGCAAVSSSATDNKSISLLNLNNDGAIILEKEINDSLVPCSIKYNEIEQTYMMILGERYFAEDSIPTDSLLSDILPTDSLVIDSALIDSIHPKTIINPNLFDAYKICYLDSLGEPIWKANIRTKGEFVDVVKSGNDFQVFINTQTELETSNEPTIRWNLSVNTIDDQGTLKNTIPIKSIASFSIQDAFKVSDASVSLIGFFGDNPDDWNGNLVYLIIDDKGDISYSNLPY